MAAETTDHVDPERLVLLVRHGETEWNASKRWQGWKDIALNDRGRDQAKAACAVFPSMVVGRAVRVASSDLARAQETAQILAAAIGVVNVDTYEGLRERNVGDWSGKTTDEINELWPGQLDAWRNGGLPVMPNGEMEDNFIARTSAALKELCEQAASGNCVVVAATHGGVIRTLTRVHGGKPLPVKNLDGAWFTLRENVVVHVANVALLARKEGEDVDTATAL